jgi:tetratricopeptide (TPR) repeat protein
MILLLAWGLTRVAGGGARELASTSITGWSRYTAPFFDSTSARHAFGFLAPGHLLAVLNDVLLAAPLLLLVVTPWWWARHDRASATSISDGGVLRFLGIAAAGCLLVNFLFARELGPYRDWDILAPYGFVLLAFVGALLLHARAQRAWALVLLAGLLHTLPWLAMNATPHAAIEHLHLVLAADSQWSPHARAYMHESLAIYSRERGDEQASLREYKAAVQANPADSRYRVGLGNRYAQRGEWRPAAREYTAALERRPGYAPAHNNLAFVLASLGEELERARRHAQRAVQLDPGNADYWLTLARVEVAAGRPAAARAALQQALQRRQPFAAAEELLQSLEE